MGLKAHFSASLLNRGGSHLTVIGKCSVLNRNENPGIQKAATSACSEYALLGIKTMSTLIHLRTELELLSVNANFLCYRGDTVSASSVF